MSTNSELIARLKARWADGNAKLEDEAADAIEALEKSHIARLLRIETKVDELIAERDALQAQLAAAQGQEPVAWIYTLEYGAVVVDTKVSDRQLNYPFGVCGADYLAKNDDGVSYVRQTPLYKHQSAQVSLLAKLPGGKKTDKWESARVADYNQGWNDYRKAAKAALIPQQPAEPAQPQLRAADHWFAEWELVIPEDARTAFKETVQQAQPEPLTDSYVQTVPDKCDRITWRNRYYHLPIVQAQPEPVWSDGTTPLVDGGLVSAGKVDHQIRAIMQAQPEREPLSDDAYEALVDDLGEWVRHVVEDTAHITLETHIRRTLAEHGIKQGGQQ